MASKFEPPRKMHCRFCTEHIEDVNYKDVNVLQKMASAQGKMFSRKRLGTCAIHQRQVKKAVKRARFLALLRYVGR